MQIICFHTQENTPETLNKTYKGLLICQVPLKHKKLACLYTMYIHAIGWQLLAHKHQSLKKKRSYYLTLQPTDRIRADLRTQQNPYYDTQLCQDYIDKGFPQKHKYFYSTYYSYYIWNLLSQAATRLYNPFKTLGKVKITSQIFKNLPRIKPGSKSWFLLPAHTIRNLV